MILRASASAACTRSWRSASSSRTRRRASSTSRSARRRSSRRRCTTTSHIRHGWPIPLALVLTVLIVSPLLGVMLDRFLFRYLRTRVRGREAGVGPRALRRDPADRQAVVRSQPAVGCGRASCPTATTVYNPFARRVRQPRRHRDRGGRTRRVRRADVAVPVHRARAADARGRREPAPDRARRGRRRPCRAWRRGCCRASLAGLAGVLLAPLFAGQVDATSTTRRSSSSRSRRPCSAGCRASRSRSPAGSGSASRSRCSTSTCRPTASSRATCDRRCRSSCCSSC